MKGYICMYTLIFNRHFNYKLCLFQMENIGNYITFCEKYLEVPKGDQFQTVDLYEKQNMGSVSKACSGIDKGLLDKQDLG